MLRSLRVILLATAPAAVLLPSTGTAQESSNPARVWATLGLGGASPFFSDARGSSAEFGVVMGQLVFQQRAHYAALRAAGALDVASESGDSFGEVDALYGRAFARRYVHLALAAGVAYTSVTYASARGYDGLGLPVLAEVSLRPLPVLGVGVQGFVNLNQHRSYGGLVAIAQLGWMP